MSKEQRSRVNDWIAKLEAQAGDLLEDVDLKDLTVKERFELALKCIGHTQRFIMIGQQLEAESPTGQTSIVMAALMRRMRGEIAIESPDVEGQTTE